MRSRAQIEKQCHYCGASAADGAVLNRDHIVPVARGGQHSAWNIVTSCVPCNLAKGSDLPTCECNRCTLALARWRAGDRRDVSAKPRRRGGQRVAARRIEYPPELACLSPGMREFLLRRGTGVA